MITVRDIKDWLNVQSDNDQAVIDVDNLRLCCRPHATSVQFLDIPAMPDEDCLHSDFAPIGVDEDDNPLRRCNECGFEWAGICHEFEEEES